MSIFEIWSALSNGATLILPSADLLQNLSGLKNFLHENRISILWLTKSLFDHIYQQDNNIFTELDYLLVGGEALSADLISQGSFQVLIRPKHIINGYGPTVASVFSTFYQCEAKKYSQVPIGRSLNNRSGYILNNKLKPVPIGL